MIQSEHQIYIKLMSYGIKSLQDNKCAKTSALIQVAQELDIPYAKINLGQLDELSDLIGFPVKEHQMNKKEHTFWVNEKNYDHYAKEGYVTTGKARTSYAPPAWLSLIDTGAKNSILILDDFSRAD